MKKNNMKDAELEIVSDKLTELEGSLLDSYGLEDEEGGYITIEVADYNDDFINVIVYSGNDEEEFESEELALHRDTLEWTD